MRHDTTAATTLRLGKLIALLTAEGNCWSQVS